MLSRVPKEIHPEVGNSKQGKLKTTTVICNADAVLRLCRVLKEVHPDVGISKQGMQVMNTFATDMFDKIVKEAAKLTQISKKATLSSREIQTAGEQSCLPLQYKVYKRTTHQSHNS